MTHTTRLATTVAASLLMGMIAMAASAAPLKIIVYGGTGSIGRVIVDEALSRGHIVTVAVRDTSASAPARERLSIVRGNVLDGALLRQQLAGQDVVVCAISGHHGAQPEGDGVYLAAAKSLVAALRALGPAAPRLIVVGGAGSLRTATGGLVAESVPKAYLGDVHGQMAALDYYRTVGDAPWSYFSPAGDIAPGERTGKFRLGGEQLLTDTRGASRISYQDYSAALIDEAERPAHLRQRFTIGY